MLQGNIWGKITILEFEAHENLMFSILLSTEQVGINIRDVRGGLFFHGAGRGGARVKIRGAGRGGAGQRWKSTGRGEKARKSTYSQNFTKLRKWKI